MVEDLGELIAVIRLHHTDGFGNAGLLSAFGDSNDPQKIVANFNAYSKTPLSFSEKDALKIVETITKLHIGVIPYYDNDYPPQSREIHSPPAMLYTRGDPTILSEKYSLAVVGTRKYTSYGKNVCSILLPDIARNRIPIISGMALGIDGFAHEQALKYHCPTVAVLGSGVNVITPIQHTHLYEQIVEHGCVVSEFPVNLPAAKYTFSQRNRIVAGLANSLLVIEAGEQSGTMITTNFALEQGKDVCVVPGPITSSSSQGTNRLLKLGATAITSPQDLLDQFFLSSATQSTQKVENPTHQHILDEIHRGCNTLEAIQEKTLIQTQELLLAISELELCGMITREGDSRVSLT